MTAPISCPSADVLRDLVQGRVSDEQAEVLENHLLHCATCLEALKSHSDGNAHEADLASRPPAVSAEFTWPQEASERVLARLYPHLTNTALPAGDTLVPDERLRGESAPSTLTEWLRFFEPPKSAGE